MWKLLWTLALRSLPLILMIFVIGGRMNEIVPQLALAQDPSIAITGILPEQFNVSNDLQELIIQGTGFVLNSETNGGSQVILRVKGEQPAEVEGKTKFTKKTTSLSIEPNQIRLMARFNEVDTFAVQVINPDGATSKEVWFKIVAEARAAFDDELLALVETRAGQFYSENWKENITLDEYRAWIFAIAWGEGGLGGYSAHSQALPGSDLFYHNDPNAMVGNQKFRFSTGLGPFQLDRLMDSWPTIDRLSREKSVDGVLRWHYETFKNRNATLEDFSGESKWCAVEVMSPSCPNSEGNPERLWEAVTGTDWYAHKDKETSEDWLVEWPLNWSTIRPILAGNTINRDPPVEFGYISSVQGPFSAQWNIPQDAKDASNKVITTNDTNKKVYFFGQLPTWRIAARDYNGKVLFDYFYTRDISRGVEIWVLDDRKTENDGLTYAFIRDYSSNFGKSSFGNPWNSLPEHITLGSVCDPDHPCLAGITLRSPALTPPATIQKGDCNKDGKVNFFDASILLSNWKKTTSTCDLNGDNTINIFDLSIMLSNWTR